MNNGLRPGLKKRRWLWWSGVTAVALLVLAVVLFRAVLPAVAGRVAGNMLGVPVSIGKIHVSIFDDNLVVENIRVAQPEGFGDEPMAQVDRVTVDGWLGVLSEVRKVDEVRVEDVRVELVAKADGTSNVKTLMESTNLVAADSTATGTESAPGDAIAAFVGRVSVSSIVVVRRDQFEDGTEHRLEMLGDQLTINRLSIGDVADAEPGDIEFTGGIVQPGVDRAEIYMGGRFSDLGTGAVNVRVSARVTGCLFDIFVPIIPENTGAMLGGNGMDADVEAKITGGLIDVLAGCETSSRASYTIAINGPVEAPKVELPKKLMAVTSRMTGGAGRLVRSTVGGGAELLEGTASTVGALGKGAISAVGNVVKGAGQTAAGVATADSEKIKSGTGKMTVEAGESVVGGVDESAHEVAEAGGNTAGALGKDPATQRWIADTPARHEKRIDGLLTGLLAEDFPPAIEGAADTGQE